MNNQQGVGFDLPNEGTNSSKNDGANYINLVNNNLIAGNKYKNKVSIPAAHGKSNDINLVNIDLIVENKNENKVSNPPVHGDRIHAKNNFVNNSG